MHPQAVSRDIHKLTQQVAGGLRESACLPKQLPGR